MKMSKKLPATAMIFLILHMLFLAYAAFLSVNLSAYAANYCNVNFYYDDLDPISFDCPKDYAFEDFSAIEESLQLTAEEGKKIVWRTDSATGEIVEFPFIISANKAFFAEIIDDPDYNAVNPDPVEPDPDEPDPADPGNNGDNPDEPGIDEPGENTGEPSNPSGEIDINSDEYEIHVICRYSDFLVGDNNWNIEVISGKAGEEIVFAAVSVQNGYKLAEIHVISESGVQITRISTSYVHFIMPAEKVEIRCYFETVAGENTLTKEQIIAVSVCGSVAGVAIICGICTLVYRRHKKKTASNNNVLSP